MCSVHEEGVENVNETVIPCRKPVKANRKCMKCSKQLAVAVVRGNDPLCRQCFLSYFLHKFRATIGKTRVFSFGSDCRNGLNIKVFFHFLPIVKYV